MKPLLILLFAFALVLVSTRVLGGIFDYHLAGPVAMAAMLVFTGVAHFPYVRGVAQMLPDWLLTKNAWVYGTGPLEVTAGIRLLVSALWPAEVWRYWYFSWLFSRPMLSRSAGTSIIRRALASGQGLSYMWF